MSKIKIQSGLLFLVLFFMTISAVSQTQIIAHRGFWDIEGSAQNSLSALKNAQKERFYGSECDIHITLDGIVVLNHDDNIDSLVINESTFARLKNVRLKNGERIPTLKNYLKQTAASSDTKLIIEIKSKKDKNQEDKVIDAALKSVKKLKMEKQVEYISFSKYICRELKRKSPQSIVVFLSGQPAEALSPQSLAAEGFDGLDYSYSVIDAFPNWIKEAKELGLTTNVWTVNDEKIMKQMLDLKVDFITTDKPLALRNLITSRLWETGIQSYTFHRFTFMETLDKLQTLGLQCVEVYYGQPLGEGFGEQKMDFRMDKATRKKVLEAAKAKNVKITASGVVICNSEQEWEELFRFAKDMGISIITCEPVPEHIDFVEKLADQYQIDVAIHNHPQPSNYWHPDIVMKALEGRSRRMGVCADVGHWKREGIDPVKALEQVGERLKSLHFKDVKAPEAGEEKQHDVIWGTGVCDVPAMLRVLKNINFNGLMSIEYEYNWDNSVPDIKKCLEMMKQNL